MITEIEEKGKWDESHFEKMTWHDCKIYAMTFEPDKQELIFDIDFILKWVEPKNEETDYNFWVAPANLIFKNVYDLNINLSSVDVIIDDLNRENAAIPKNAAHIKEKLEFDWIIETTNGSIVFKSVGFEQYLRKEPIFSNKQYLDR